MELYSLEPGRMMILVFFLILFLIPAIFFLITQQNTLKAIRPENRFMQPGQVWLQLIPIFNFVWQFIVVSRIADSIGRELAESEIFSFEEPADVVNRTNEERPTYQIGISYCILYCVSIFPIPMLKGLVSIACIVCWIVYWVKLAGYKKRIQERNFQVSPPAAP